MFEGEGKKKSSPARVSTLFPASVNAAEEAVAGEKETASQPTHTGGNSSR